MTRLNPLTLFLAMAEFLHRFCLAACMVLLAVLFSAQITVVVLRYLFSIGFVELQDFVLYCFALLSVLGIPVALRLDRHVRVDIFRKSNASKAARRMDQFGYAAFLVPLCAVTFTYALPLVMHSWKIREGARETGGLDGYYLIITILPVVCVLTVIQAVALFVDKSLIHRDGAP